MNTQEYIQSGIIESYVLGLASEEERKEFEAYCDQYPEVRAARDAFEKRLEEQAFSNAIAPDPDQRVKLLNSLGLEDNAAAMAAPVRRMQWLRYAAAACLVLLAGSVYYNIELSGRNKRLQEKYDNSVASLNRMEEDLKVIQSNNSIKMAALSGQPASPASFTTVYWDTASHDVYLLINNLPKPASDKQYQLWAFIDGQPQDMGLIEITEKPLQLYKLKKAQAAQAFAITLEERGRKDISKPAGQVYVANL